MSLSLNSSRTVTGVAVSDKRPERIDLKLDIGLFLKVKVRINRASVENEFSVVVMVTEFNTLCGQHRLILIEQLNGMVERFLIRCIHPRNDITLVANGLVILHRTGKIIFEIAEAGMRTGNGKAVFVKPFLDLVRHCDRRSLPVQRIRNP